MDETMIFFRILILNGLLVFCNQTYSQEMDKSEIIWINIDSSYDLSFSDTAEALEWVQHQSSFAPDERPMKERWRMEWDEKEPYTWSMVVANSTSMHLKNENFYIVIVLVGSGVICQNFYVFKSVGVAHWQLIATSQAIIPEDIELESKGDKIIFKTKTGIVGEFHGT